MKLKTYYSKFFSWPLMLENMKRFWAISVVGFLLYFLSGAFPMLMEYDNISIYTLQNIFANHNAGYMAAHLFLALAAAVSVFKYLQTTGGVSVMHSMPFSRKTLYVSSYTSGLALAYLPAFLNGLVLLILKTPVYQTAYAEMSSVNVDIFTYSGVFTWMFESFVIIAFLYSIAIFAGMVTGTVIMHVLTAGAFNFLAGALYATFTAYASIYFFGFTFSRYVSELGLRLSPYTYVFEHGGHFGRRICAIYLLIAAVISIATYYIYKRRPLERATDSTVFKFMEYFICFLIVFFSSSLVGLAFYENDYGYGGYALGGILGFIVGQMIVKKTMKIFDMESLRSFIIYIGIMPLILVGFSADLIGYEKNIPSIGKVKSVEIESYELALGRRPIVFEDVENIQSAIDFHADVVAERSQYRDFYGSGVSFNLRYNLENGKQIARQYYLPYSVFMQSADFKNFIESTEADADVESLNSFDRSATEIYFYPQGNDESLTLYYSDDIYYNNIKKGLLAALVEDATQMTAEEILGNSVPFLQIEVMNRTAVKVGTSNNATREQTYEYEYGQPDYAQTSYSFSITKEYKHTIEWLKNNGYERFLINVGESDFAIITNDSVDQLSKDGYMMEADMNDKYGGVYMSDYTLGNIELLKENNLVIEDKELLSNLLKNYAAIDTRFIKDEKNILYMNLYTFYDYNEDSHYEYAGVYYLDKNNLPEEVKIGLKKFL